MARKKKHEEHENHERWLVSYADFITLLFAFFTVLYALGQGDKAQMQQAMASIRSSLLTGGGMFGKSGDSFLPTLRPGAGGSGRSAQEATLDRLASMLGESAATGTGSSEGSSPFDVEALENGLLVALNSDVMFKPGRTELTDEAKKTLKEIGIKLREMRVPIEVRGYSLRFGYEVDSKNWNTSVQRAISVARYFIDEIDFISDQISVSGHTVPAGEGSAGGKGRRVEIHLEVNERDMARLGGLGAE